MLAHMLSLSAQARGKNDVSRSALVRRRLDRDDEMDGWPRPWRSAILLGVLGALMLILVALLVLAAIALRSRDEQHVVGPDWFAWADTNCENAPFSCAVVAGALVAPIPIV